MGAFERCGPREVDVGVGVVVDRLRDGRGIATVGEVFRAERVVARVHLVQGAVGMRHRARTHDVRVRHAGIVERAAGQEVGRVHFRIAHGVAGTAARGPAGRVASFETTIDELSHRGRDGTHGQQRCQCKFFH